MDISIKINAKSLWFFAQVVLIILKLGGVLNTSWWLIWLPTLLPIGAVVGMFIIMFIAAVFSPKFREFIHNASDEIGEKKVEIEINGVDNEGDNTRR